MDYLVFARKYRPQTFSEVAGQEVVARTLANAIRTSRVAHAYLFTGPRGVGKTSMARILAKALCCETGPTATPCGTCQHCRMITDSTHPDVAEIDAARYSGVDAIRELGEGAHFAPTLARSRLIILDEVHMLSNNAWNALLKLLEEPPPHLRFIFATTEVDKVLPTVLSRCQRFDFRSIDLDHIVARLRAICAKEGRELGEGVLLRLARAAGGGMRDAQTLLDQLIATSDGAVTEDDLNLLLGAARGEDLDALALALAQGRAGDALAAVDRACAGGVAPATLAEQLVDQLRGALLTQACGAEAPAVRRLGLPAASLSALAQAMPQDRLLRGCQILVQTQQAVRAGADARLQLELAVVRMAHVGQLIEADALLRRLERVDAAGPPRPR